MRSSNNKRQSKAVTATYASLAAIILLVIAAIALVVVPPSPPSVAEFAPQATEQIDQAPDQQSSQFGSGVGACGTGQVCEGQDAAIAPPKKVIERARVRRCVGDPPRQIEDPQSPPCINYWQGDNGGATSRGVTRDEIRFSITASYEDSYGPIVSFFNSRFEFYGRKIRLVGYPPTPITPEGIRARAVAAHERGGFAASTYPCAYGRCQPFWRESARLRLITVTQDAELTSTDQATSIRMLGATFPPAIRWPVTSQSSLVTH